MLETQAFDVKPKAPKRRPKLPNNPESDPEGRAVGLGRFPSWLHRKLPKGNALWKTDEVLKGKRLNTVCEEASCPNLMECWTKKTATFLALGFECTRACGFCDIATSKTPPAADPNEPERIAESAKALGLKHVVVTMVARDDMPDGGAAHIAEIIRQVRIQSPESTIEVLTSDFAGNHDAWREVIAAKPDIFNYNIETVRELTPRVRHKATYERTLELLRFIKVIDPNMLTKSGLMLGLGESEAQVHQALADLLAAGVDIVTIGQYLQPNPRKLLVKAFITPEQFKQYEEYGLDLGISHVYSGPFVRSSYNADRVLEKVRQPQTYSIN